LRRLGFCASIQDPMSEHIGLRLMNLYRKAYGTYTPQVILIIVLAVLSSVLEALGISSIIPVFSFVGGGGGNATDMISTFIANLFGFFHLTYTFRTLIIFIAALFIVRTVFLFLIQTTTARIVFGYERDAPLAVFQHGTCRLGVSLAPAHRKPGTALDDEYFKCIAVVREHLGLRAYRE